MRTLNPGDRFNIVTFSSNVSSMMPGLIEASRSNIEKAVSFVNNLLTSGGTNINDALVRAMQMFGSGRHARNLVFVTDGRANVNVSDPDQIASNVRAANTAQARLFTFGVGTDVNKVLLERLASENRGTCSSIEDESQVGRIVTNFFAKVSQPVLSDMRLEFGALQIDRVYPAELPDMYTRSQLKVFGRYRNPDELGNAVVTLTGAMGERPQQFEFGGLHFPLVATDKDFLPKLWATERVNALLAEIRLHGERAELKREVIELAREFDLVTPYTSMYVPSRAESAGEGAADAARAAVPQATAGEGQGPMNGRSVNLTTAVGELKRSFNSLAQLTPGTVVDANGAVIPNATVIIRDKNSGAARTVTTDGSGNYSVAGIQPGNYNIEVTAPGFTKTVVENVPIQPGQVAATGVELSVGSTTETVTVTGVAPALDTDVGYLSSSYESRKIRELPSLLPVESFTRLAPGILSITEIDSSRNRFSIIDPRGEFEFAINGGRMRSKRYLLNALNNDGIDGAPVISINNFDAVDALHLMTTRGSGDSRTGASALNLMTRTGTNEFHGTVFDYHLNRRLGAMSPLEKRSGLDEAPISKSTLYGGTLGGPIKRDRLFFFGAFAGEFERARVFTDSTAARLTPSERGLTQLSALFPRSRTVQDLVARGPFALDLGNPRTLRTFLIPVGGVPIEFAEVIRAVPTSARGFETGARLDFALTNRDQLQFNYWYDGRRSSNVIGQLAAGLAGDARSRGQLAGVRWNRTLSPRTSTELSFGFNRTSIALDKEAITSSPGPYVNLAFRGLSYGGSSVLPFSANSTLFEIATLTTHVAGRHNLRLGGQVARKFTSFDHLMGNNGAFSFARFDDFVLDLPATLTIAIGDPHSRFTELDQHYYIDDAWRWRSNVTTSFGLSYEQSTQPLNGFITHLRRRESNPATALFNSGLPVDRRVPAPISADLNNVAPRIGIAYSPRFRFLGLNLFGNDQTVIRAGASVSYDQTAYRPLSDLAASAPSVLLATLTSDSGLTGSFPAVPNAGELRSVLGGDPRNYARTELARNFRSPYSLGWHFTASREFERTVMLEAGYVGTRGIGLIQALDGNPLVGQSGAGGPLRIYSSTGRASYHSFQARNAIRVSDAVNVGMSYTFSHSIDDVPENAASFGLFEDRDPGLQLFAQNPFDLHSERAPSSLNRSHRFAAHFTWALPVRRGQRGVIGRLLGGWEATGIIELASGLRYTPLQSLGQFPGTSALFASVFSDRLGAVRPFEGNPAAPLDSVAFSNAANQFFRFFVDPSGTPFSSSTGFILANRNGYRAGTLSEARFIYNDFAVEQAALAMGLGPNAFGQTFAAGRPFGDVRRNELVGPQLKNIDFALVKTTKLTEKVSLQFRGEFYNLLNHPSRTLPNPVLENAGGFGFNDLGETDASPRRVRLALKLIF